MKQGGEVISCPLREHPSEGWGAQWKVVQAEIHTEAVFWIQDTDGSRVGKDRWEGKMGTGPRDPGKRERKVSLAYLPGKVGGNGERGQEVSEAAEGRTWLTTQPAI